MIRVFDEYRALSYGMMNEASATEPAPRLANRRPSRDRSRFNALDPTTSIKAEITENEQRKQGVPCQYNLKPWCTTRVPLLKTKSLPLIRGRTGEIYSNTSNRSALNWMRQPRSLMSRPRCNSMACCAPHPESLPCKVFKTFPTN